MVNLERSGSGNRRGQQYGFYRSHETLEEMGGCLLRRAGGAWSCNGHLPRRARAAA
jgi:hypothetical protein